MSAPACCKSVYDRTTRWPLPHPCRNKAVVEREGRWYCRVHDPVEIKRKQEDKHALWEKQSRERMSERHLNASAPRMRDALLEIMELTTKQQLPITAQIHAIAAAGLPRL